MMKAIYLVPAFAGALLMSTAAMAVTGEFGNMCALNLAQGKKVDTNCSVNGEIGGKTYCFISEAAKTTFMKDPQTNIAKASDFYKSF